MRIARFRAASAALIVPFLALTGGCLFGDDSTPSADDAVVAQSDEDVAEGVSGTAVELLGAMIDAVGGIDQPPPAPFRTESVNWNGQTGIWTVSGDDSYDDPESTGDVTYTLTVQFLSGGTPQQYVDDFTDQIEITVSAHNVGNFHPADREFDLDYDFTAAGALHATASAGLITVTGTGSLLGATQAHIGQATITRQQNASWTYDFTVDTTVPDDCPAGTFGGTTNNFTFSGSFDGGIANWNVLRGGVVVRTVTQDLSCGGSSQAQ